LILAGAGAEPGLIGQDRSPVTGFVQLSIFMIGLGLITLAGSITLSGLWPCTEKSILYDVGFRMVATGYVIAVATGMADVFGFGGQEMPLMRFGAWQRLGVMCGEFTIAIGFLLMLPRRRNAKPSGDEPCNDDDVR